MIPYMFVTQSEDKVHETERILGMPLIHRDLDLPEVQAVDGEGVVTEKVRLAYARVKAPVMIEDTGLYIRAWNGLPGALVKWFLQRVGPEGICKMLEPYADRSATAKTIVATYDGHGEPHIFVGKVAGQIAQLPQGDSGFGWDAVFIPNGARQTFAEMGPEEKDRYSMRRLAFEAMRDAHSSGTGLKKERP